MKPTSEMTQQEAACFVNLKKAMNESYLVLDYLKQADTLAPNIYAAIAIGTCISMIEDTITDIRHAVQSLTN